MRLYLVTSPVDANTNTSRIYCATGAEATTKRLALFDEIRDQGFKKSDITIEQVDVPTDKAGLLAYLNDLVS